jgi:hypothetical protein
MPAGITYVLASHKEVCGLSAKAFTHKSTYPIDRDKKRTGRVFSRLSLIKGPVENHDQILKKFFVIKGGTAIIINRDIFTRPRR